jgi:hypothetical protein
VLVFLVSRSFVRNLRLCSLPLGNSLLRQHFEHVSGFFGHPHDRRVHGIKAKCQRAVAIFVRFVDEHATDVAPHHVFARHGHDGLVHDGHEAVLANSQVRTVLHDGHAFGTAEVADFLAVTRHQLGDLTGSALAHSLGSQNTDGIDVGNVHGTLPYLLLKDLVTSYITIH